MTSSLHHSQLVTWLFIFKSIVIQRLLWGSVCKKNHITMVYLYFWSFNLVKFKKTNFCLLLFMCGNYRNFISWHHSTSWQAWMCGVRNGEREFIISKFKYLQKTFEFVKRHINENGLVYSLSEGCFITME